MTTCIMSCGVCIPSDTLSPDSILEDINVERRYGIPNNYISQSLGIDQRYIAEPGTQPSTLAIGAAQKALDSCPEVQADDIDAVIFCGINKDHEEPATAHNVAHGLNLKPQKVFDITNACFGFIESLQVAAALIKTGDIRYALIATGEVQRPHLDWLIDELKKDLTPEEAANKVGFLSAGDAGGAVILGPSKEKGFRAFNSRTDSSHAKLCFYQHDSNQGYLAEMQMGPIVARGFQLQKKALYSTMAELGWDRFDWLLTHQTGIRNFNQFKKLNIVDPDRMIKTFNEYGNITSATFPVAYHKLMQRKELKPGDRIGGNFAGSGIVAGQFGLVY